MQELPCAEDLLNFRQDLFCLPGEGTGGLEVEDLIEGGPGGGELLELEIAHAEIKEDFGVFRLLSGGFLEEIDGTTMIVAVMVSDPKGFGDTRICGVSFAGFEGVVVGF
jgi:hypothetical protein